MSHTSYATVANATKSIQNHKKHNDVKALSRKVLAMESSNPKYNMLLDLKALQNKFKATITIHDANVDAWHKDIQEELNSLEKLKTKICQMPSTERDKIKTKLNSKHKHNKKIKYVIDQCDLINRFTTTFYQMSIEQLTQNTILEGIPPLIAQNIEKIHARILKNKTNSDRSRVIRELMGKSLEEVKQQPVPYEDVKATAISQKLMYDMKKATTTPENMNKVLRQASQLKTQNLINKKAIGGLRGQQKSQLNILARQARNNPVMPKTKPSPRLIFKSGKTTPRASTTTKPRESTQPRRLTRAFSFTKTASTTTTPRESTQPGRRTKALSFTRRTPKKT